MAEVLAELLTSAVVGIAKDKLASAIADKANLLWDFKDDLEDMEEILKTISEVLQDAERWSAKEVLVQLWLKRLKNSALDISDMLEDYQETSKQLAATIPRELSCLPIACKKISLATRMKSMREELNKINKQFQDFNFKQGASITSTEWHDDGPETSSCLPDQPIIGRNVEKQENTNLLSAGMDNEETLIVAICGHGGMGKSTLAQQIYNERIFIRNGAFSFAKCLCILDFSGCSTIQLPASIGELKQLKYLVAPRMQTEVLPVCITELAKLQYLHLNGSSCISTLPESTGKLAGCLEFLGLSGCTGISQLPSSIGDLKCLKHLNMSGCSGIKELPDSLGDLTNLQHLELSQCYRLKAIPESLCALTHLQYLNLSSCKSIKRLPEAIGSLVHLQHLNMSGCGVRELPESFKRLGNLLHLELTGCFIKKRLVGALYGLTALQHLSLSTAIDEENMEMDDLPDALRYLTNLKHLDLSARNDSLVNNDGYLDFIGTLTNLEHLNLSENLYLEYLPESIGYLKRLHTLNLEWCQRLKSFPESIGSATGLKSLLLDECSPELIDQANSLFHYSLTLPLFKVRADDVSAKSNLHLLQGENEVVELKIISLENVMFLEEAQRLKLVNKQSLVDLTLCWTEDADRHVEEKDLLGELVPPMSLKSFRLEGYSSWSLPSWIMDNSHQLPALQKLYLCKCPNLTSLPEGIRQLCSLQFLRLECCDNISALPEWLSDISSLKELIIWECMSIYSLPSCINQLTNLQELFIFGNKELGQWCDSEENKAKLAHIKDITRL